MDNKKFKAPDETAIARMTPATIESLLETLRDQRAAKVRNIDEEIKWYEDLLEQKREKATGGLPKGPYQPKKPDA